MQRKRVGVAATAAAAALLLTSCAGAVSDEYVIENDPGSVEHVEGSDLGRVTLTGAAARRLGIQTAEVTRSRGRLVVPAEAVLVDPDGNWWVYTSPRPRQYIRHAVDIVRETDGRAVLSEGPAVGTEVVTVGVAEVYGVEFEVGH
jgi:hypothetical protein